MLWLWWIDDDNDDDKIDLKMFSWQSSDSSSPVASIHTDSSPRSPVSQLCWSLSFWPPGICGSDFKNINFGLNLQIDISNTTCECCDIALSRDHFGCAASQWEMMRHCSVVSYWLGAYTKWTLLRFRWMPQNPIDDESAVVHVMARCYHATSHYLSQCWPRSMLPYGIARPWWVTYRRNRCKDIILTTHGGKCLHNYKNKYCEASYINCSLVGNKIVGNWDVVGASPVGAAPPTSSFST